MIFDTATAGKQAHLIPAQKGRYDVRQGGVLSGNDAVTNTANLETILSAASAGGEVFFGNKEEVLIVTGNAQLLIGKALTFRGRAVIEGDSAVSKDNKSDHEYYLFKVNANLKVRGLRFHHLGTVFNGRDWGRDIASMADNLRFDVQGCKFFECRVPVGKRDSNSDWPDDAFKTVELFRFEKNEVKQCGQGLILYAAKYKYIYVQKNRFTKIYQNTAIYSDLSSVGQWRLDGIRIGRDIFGDLDVEFKKVKICKISGNLFDDFQNKVPANGGTLTLYVIRLYVHEADVKRNRFDYLWSEDTVIGEAFPDAVAAIYFRGKDSVSKGNRFINCGTDRGTNNGFIRFRAGAQFGKVTNCHFETTDSYHDELTAASVTDPTTCAILMEKSGTMRGNTIKNCRYIAITRGSTFDGTRQYWVFNGNETIFDTSKISQAAIFVFNAVNHTVNKNEFIGGATITFASDEAAPGTIRINDNNFTQKDGGNNSRCRVTLQTSSLLHASRLEFNRNTAIIKQEHTDWFQITGDCNSELVAEIAENHVFMPPTAGWANFFQHYDVRPTTGFRRLQMRDNYSLNGRNRMIRLFASAITGVIEELDLYNNIGDGDFSDVIRFWNSPAATKMRIYMPAGMDRTENKGVASVTTASTSVSHGVKMINGEGRDAIESGEVELRVLGDMSPATHARAVKTSATAFSIELNDTPAAACDIQWIAKRTDQFE